MSLEDEIAQLSQEMQEMQEMAAVVPYRNRIDSQTSEAKLLARSLAEETLKYATNRDFPKAIEINDVRFRKYRTYGKLRLKSLEFGRQLTLLSNNFAVTSDGHFVNVILYGERFLHEILTSTFRLSSTSSGHYSGINNNHNPWYYSGLRRDRERQAREMAEVNRLIAAGVLAHGYSYPAFFVSDPHFLESVEDRESESARGGFFAVNSGELRVGNSLPGSRSAERYIADMLTQPRNWDKYRLLGDLSHP